jgi:hypothetical protein
MSDEDEKATEGTADETNSLKHIGGSESDAWNKYIGAQALASIRPYIGDEEKRDKMRAIVTAGLNGIAPRDEVEGMIAAQMLACHDTAMGCFRDALNSKLHGRLWHEYLEQANKLSRTFAMLLDALNRHCGKGQQRIVVEHVNIHPGGQAVVGIVEARGEGFSRDRRIKPMEGILLRLPHPRSRAAAARPAHNRLALRRSGSACGWTAG